MQPTQIANIILNITFIATFIGIFFFTYGKTIEENIVKTQSEFVADSIAKDISTFLDKPTTITISKQIQIPDMSKQDINVQTQNSQLQQKAFHILAIVFISGIIITILITKLYKLNFFSLLKTNLIVLLFVGLTEYIFLTYIGQNFISADPNFVRYKILTKLKSKLNTQSILPSIQEINLLSLSPTNFTSNYTYKI